MRVSNDCSMLNMCGLFLRRPQRAPQFVRERAEPARRRRSARSVYSRSSSASFMSCTAFALRRMRRPPGSTSRTMTSTSAPTGNVFRTSDSLATPVSLVGTSPMRPGARKTNTPNRSCRSTLPLRRAPGTMPWGAGTAPPSDSAPFSTSATPIRFFSRSMFRISNAPVVPGVTEDVHPPVRPVGANVDWCASASTPGSSSTNAPNSATRVTRPTRTWPTW